MCNYWGFGYGNFWHLGNLLFILILFVGVAVLVYHLIVNNGNRVSGRTVAANHFN